MSSTFANAYCVRNLILPHVRMAELHAVCMMDGSGVDRVGAACDVIPFLT